MLAAATRAAPWERNDPTSSTRRNSGIQSVIPKLKKKNCNIDLYDPWADKKAIKKKYDIYPISKLKKKNYDSILIAVSHKKFKDMGLKFITSLCKEKHIIFDLKYLFPKSKYN